MFVSPHCHAESPLTGSTLANLVGKAKQMGRSYFVYTDHGHLSSALKAYGLCKSDKRKIEDLAKINKEYLKKEIKFIPGIEIYFKDSKCPFVVGTPADRCKYFTATLYCHTQEEYQNLCRMISRSDFPTTTINEEEQQLWSWNNLEEISKYGADIILTGIHCVVGKTFLAGHPDIGERVFKRLKEIFGDRLYVALLAEPWLKKWSNVIEIVYKDGTKDSLLASDMVETDKARRMKTMDLVEKSHHTMIKSKTVGGTYYEINKMIQKSTLHKGFLPLPGGDASLKVNRFLKALANKHGVTILVTDYAYYADKEDKIVQTMRLEGNNKLQPSLHMKDDEEIKNYLINVLGLTESEAKKIINNNEIWASRFDNFKLDYKWRLAEVEGDPLKIAMEIIKKNGRMRWDDPMWVHRLREELEIIAKNPKKDLTAYFLPIRDVLNYYKENGWLTGPGRGSSGGSLFCYLLGITQVNPFKYNLPFYRFFSLDRINLNKLPDIDVDLGDRELLVGKDKKSGYLYGRWGNKAAQISTRHTLRLKSTIKDTNRYLNGRVEQEIELLTKGLPDPPQGVTDYQFVFGYEDTDGDRIPGLIEQSEDLLRYTKNRPQEWAIVEKAMGLTRAFSQHASAFALCDIPISDIIPIKDGNITQYEAGQVEVAGLIKYDFLVVSQLKDIQICLELINKKNKETKTIGYFTHDNKEHYIWDLPEIGEVFKSVWSGQTETIFQINTRSMQPIVIETLPNSVIDIATILALDRPGPLDFIDPFTGRNMVQEYILRRRGESKPDIKELYDLLPETHGVICFQEQLNAIARKLAGFSGEEAEMLRENMAKKKMEKLIKMKPQFIEGAIKNTSKEIAEAIWDRMVTFGRYGFSIIHSVEYAMITYACMFLKYYYPLEWWAAVLTNAEEKEITGKLWSYVKDMVNPPDINLSSDIMTVDYANQTIRSKMGVIRGMGDKTIEPIVNGRPYKDIQDFVNKDVAGPSLSNKLIYVGVLDSLFPPRLSPLEKLKMYDDAVENKKYADKVKKAEETGKKIKQLQPKQGEIPEEYVNLSPMKAAALKKSILPSLPVDLHSLGRRYSKAKLAIDDKPMVKGSRGHPTPLVNGERLKRLDEMDQDSIKEDVYVAATCFVIDAKEFSYAKGQKRALKLNLDTDGFVHEKVLWPQYDTGALVYPKELKKGAIVTIFFKKGSIKKDLYVVSVTIEA